MLHRALARLRGSPLNLTRVTARTWRAPSSQQMVLNPSKASKALIEVASRPTMPLRLPLTTEAYCLIKMKATMTLAQLEEWAPLSHSTNKDGVDQNTVMQTFGAVNR
ncbi:hypothetical protein FB45DRAFT_1028929 [Roridomyces roridus]|uniref:Uncharacterized protein n=1 Tax=Roridomyces roridus TaxID=1738132 RepID=A0AAD7BS49_9AGAR|nr:hypothetical protein FB45DRAFT_1028929 [Roridomyces roridus]